jgi:spore coat polysaccharide biosynthesis protein SpsF
VADHGVVALVQARMGSTRLPGKVLMPLGGKTVLEHVLNRASEFSRQVVVCTSTGPEDDAIDAHCASLGVVCVRGSRDDVFDRFRQALNDPRVIQTPWFARVTADCPLLSSALCRRLMAHTGAELDVVTVRGDDVIRGVAAELVRRASFEAIDPMTLDGPQREHVTLCFYDEPARFHVRFVDVPEPLNHATLRLTLDYPEDYEVLGALFEGDPDLTAEDAAARLLREPELAAINQGKQQKSPR